MISDNEDNVAEDANFSQVAHQGRGTIRPNAKRRCAAASSGLRFDLSISDDLGDQFRAWPRKRGSSLRQHFP